MERTGEERRGMEGIGEERIGEERIGMEWNGKERRGVERDGRDWKGMVLYKTLVGVDKK